MTKIQITIAYKPGKKKDYYGVIVNKRISPFSTDKNLSPEAIILLLENCLNQMVNDQNLPVEFISDLNSELFKNYK